MSRQTGEENFSKLDFMKGYQPHLFIELKNYIQGRSKFKFWAGYPGLLLLIRFCLKLAILKSIRSHKCTTFEFDDSCYYARPTYHFSFIMSLLSFEILHHILLLLIVSSN